MASYSTIPKDEAEPLVAAAPKAASPKFKAAALVICLASAVAGYQAPAAIKYLSLATGGKDLPSSQLAGSWDVQGDNPDGALNGDKDENLVTLYTKTNSPKQGIQKFTLEKYSAPGQKDRYYLRFMSKSGKYNGCAALYGRNGQYSNGGSPIQMQECIWGDNSGGQRQQITLPMGGGNPTKGKKYDGKLDYVLTQKLCIGGPDGRLTDNVPVESDTCNTEYTVKYL